MPPVEAIPVAEGLLSRYEVAAQILDRAVQSGCQDANVLYMLALAHKRQGKTNEARNALRKITKPDANVLLQMGLLSLKEGNLVQAESELVRARELDQNAYEISFNLLLTQLTLGKLKEASDLLPQALELTVQNPDERQFLVVLQSLLRAAQKATGGVLVTDPVLLDMNGTDEARLLKVLKSLGQIDIIHSLLRTLSEARMRSTTVKEAYIEAVLVKGKDLLDKGHWTEAELLLRPMATEKAATKANQTALLNLLGCCDALTQDFDVAIGHFSAAVKLNPNDPRLQQNLALAHELNGDLQAADPHWNRYFDLLDRRVPVPTDLPEYVSLLAYEGLSRLAGKYSEKEKWNSAVGYIQRAASLRPNDPDTLERLFHLYNHAKRTRDARRTLEQLRHLRPHDPQLDLYELDLIEVKGLNDIERLLTDIDAILKRHPGDVRVEERAVSMVGNVIPLMGSLCDQLTDQMSKVIDQVRNLPNYQINWSAVREVMRDLLKEFQKLRRITGKCLPLVTSDEHRRIIRDLTEHIDKKMEACRSMGA
jgi:Flp pilus assembly protein TadD